MKRTYNANVRAWVGFPQVAVHVSGAPFYRDGAVGFEGMRDGNTVRFTIVGVADELAYILGSVPGLAEVIDQTTWLTYDGTAVAHIAANHITGTFDGLIKLRDATSDATLVECRATDHKMEFVR